VIYISVSVYYLSVYLDCDKH